MAHNKVRGFFRTTLDNLNTYRTIQRERYTVRSIDGTRERNRHNLYLVQ